MTNYEKIKNMSVEEMAEKIDKKNSCDACPIKHTDYCSAMDYFSKCYDCIVEWLNKEVSE